VQVAYKRFGLLKVLRSNPDLDLLVLAPFPVGVKKARMLENGIFSKIEDWTLACLVESNVVVV
jgi:hypothetical protein